MKLSILIILIFFSQGLLVPQSDAIVLNSYSVLSSGNFVSIENSEGEVVLQLQFNNPNIFISDVDSDGLDELIIVDSLVSGNTFNYVLYLYSTLDNLGLIDSIYSGSFFPVISYSDEIESAIIITGNSEFLKFSTNGENDFLPIDTWKLDDHILLPMNEELYEPFVSENSNLVQILEEIVANSPLDCEISIANKGLIAAVFTNYINAGEQSLAAQTLKKYYVCPEIEQFKKEILETIYPEAK